MGASSVQRASGGSAQLAVGSGAALHGDGPALGSATTGDMRLARLTVLAAIAFAAPSSPRCSRRESGTGSRSSLTMEHSRRCASTIRATWDSDACGTAFASRAIGRCRDHVRGQFGRGQLQTSARACPPDRPGRFARDRRFRLPGIVGRKRDTSIRCSRAPSPAPPGGAADKVRTGDQSQDCEGARPWPFPVGAGAGG
jgi:hypothetical protein